MGSKKPHRTRSMVGGVCRGRGAEVGLLELVGGELIVSGRVSTGVHFQHADGTEYGKPVVPRAAESRTKVFQALRGLGFGEKHVKLALERVGAQVGNGTEFEPLFREALALLTP